MYLIALMSNVIEECDIFGKREQLSVHVQDDPFVQIKCRKEFRSREAKLLCDKLNYNRIECDYVSRRRDREPSRITAKKLKRLSLNVSVGTQFLKQIPLSSKLYPYIKCRLKRNQNMKRREITSVKFVKKVRKKPVSYTCITPRRKLHETRLTFFGRYIGKRKWLNLKKYQTLYIAADF